MAQIRLLPRQIADIIAAGEVVERPASAVKELVENSIDSGASAITAEIKQGGMTYIKITDNGCGIRRDEVKTAFLRHATSKVTSLSDLESITTLGFRGEALAAISSVSQIEITTRSEDEEVGTRAVLDCGEVSILEPAARPSGTTIMVSNLFRNTPARQKYIKSDRSESAAVSDSIKRIALSRPDIAIKYIRDNETEFSTPGDGREDSCVYAVLGRDFMKASLYAEYSDENALSRGYISSAESLRGNRSGQYFFINGRGVKSRVMQAALETAYKNRMLPGRFPACVIWVETGFSRVDVNVHPAKTEVRFLFEKQIFDAVYRLALGALDSVPQEDEISHASANHFNNDFKDIGGGKYSRSMPQSNQGTSAPRPRHDNTASTGERTYNIGSYIQDIESYNTASEYTQGYTRGYTHGYTQTKIAEIGNPDYRLIGEALSRYIIAESDDKLIFIDKHAVHERMIFNRLEEDAYDPAPQTLIVPLIINSPESETLLENADSLEKIGYSIEPFGFGAAAVRTIPCGGDAFGAKNLLEEIASGLSNGDFDLGRHRDETLASIACRSAIKTGDENESEELAALVNEVVSGRINHCPHGRPVSWTLTQTELDKTFKRIT